METDKLKMAFMDALQTVQNEGPTAAISRVRKGQMAGVQSLTPLALAVVSLAIVVGIGVIVLAEMDGAVNNTDASAVLTTAISSLQTFADFFTVIVIIGIAAVLFLLLRTVRRAGGSA